MDEEYILLLHIKLGKKWNSIDLIDDQVGPAPQMFFVILPGSEIDAPPVADADDLVSVSGFFLGATGESSDEEDDSVAVLGEALGQFFVDEFGAAGEGVSAVFPGEEEEVHGKSIPHFFEFANLRILKL